MKIVRFKWEQAARYGIIDGNDVLSMEGDILGDFSAGEKLCSLDEIEILPPVEPGIVVGLGGNYHSLLAVDTSVHSKPEPFLKPRSAVIGHLGGIIYPKIVDNIHMEAELAIIMKREASHVPEGSGKDYILGYTCANDVTAHIEDDRGHTRAKALYTFCPIGPYIVTDDIDPDNTTITSWLNGELVQDHDSTTDMVYNIDKIISFITEFMTLNPLDVILTGTARPPALLNVGDVVEIEVGGIGKLKNTIVE
jgi:2-keto-4-pentenoate hydratase/2-oxohepta-3-ene-1,7-dioic acid hydratase in catechol pathway